jgi:phosphoglycerate dehydrogenase-like enzyme
VLDREHHAAQAQAMAPWRERLPGAEITYFRDLLGGTEQAAAALRDYQVVVAMRERTAFSRELLSQLPQLRLLVTTGMRNAAIDVAAAKELGVTVCGTGADGATTSELTWALILALLRPVQLDDAHVRDGGWQRRLGGDHWLRTAPRTVLSPHMGYVSARGYRVFYGDAVEDIAAYLRGEPIRLL